MNLPSFKLGIQWDILWDRHVHVLHILASDTEQMLKGLRKSSYRVQLDMQWDIFNQTIFNKH